MRRVRAQIFALLAALLLLLPGGVSAYAQYYCPMLGQVVESCCCKSQVAAQAARPSQRLEVADCCQRLSSASHAAPFGTHDALQGVATAALLFTLAAPQRVTPSLGARSACTESTQAPLAIGPPLFVAHCALLS